MRVGAITLFLASVVAPVGATILQHLALDEMARKSTSVVRARVKDSRQVIRGGDVFTVYRLETLEVLKRGPMALELAVPGGVAGGVRQVVAGAPTLRSGKEYVLFLWIDRSGLTQLTGMSQGLFSVDRTVRGDGWASREAIGEQMLDAAGRPVRDEMLSMSLPELKVKISKALSAPATPRPTLTQAVK